MVDEWVYIDEYAQKGFSDVDIIHCDTRDFHILCVKSDPEYYKEVKSHLQVFSILCYLSRDEILMFLKDLEIQSGGKGKWRFLSTKHHPDWIKYIRFIKVDDDLYIMYESCGGKHIALPSSILKDEIITHNHH